MTEDPSKKNNDLEDRLEDDKVVDPVINKPIQNYDLTQKNRHHDEENRELHKEIDGLETKVKAQHGQTKSSSSLLSSANGEDNVFKGEQNDSSGIHEPQSSSTTSMDRMHEEKFCCGDCLQKVSKELEDMKIQNEDYQKMYQDALDKIKQQEEIIAHEFEMHENEIRNFRNCLNQSDQKFWNEFYHQYKSLKLNSKGIKAEFEMYEDGIRNLQSELNQSNQKISQLEKEQKELNHKYKPLKLNLKGIYYVF